MSVAVYNRRPTRFYSKIVAKTTGQKIFYYFFPEKGDSIFEIIRKIIFFAAIITLIFWGTTTLNQYLSGVRAHKTDNNTAVNISNNIHNEELYDPGDGKPKMLAAFEDEYKKNSDVIGYINIPNKDYPNDISKSLLAYSVYQATNNDFYLKHDSRKKKNDCGAIYADYRCDISTGIMPPNTILYGHNFYGGGFFTNIVKYYKADTWEEFYSKYPIIEYTTLYERAKWKVFAAVLFNTNEKYGEVYPYNETFSFESEDDFNNYIIDIMDRSVIFTDVDFEYGDQILTLSSCYYPFDATGKDTRVAVFARKVRPGEDAYVNTAKATYNTMEYRWETQKRLLGSNWPGETVWDTSYLKGYDEKKR